MEQFFQKLEEKQALYQEIAEKLAQPEVIANPTLYKRLAKMRHALEQTVDAYLSLRNVHQQIAGVQEILRVENDKEIRELAEIELTELQKRDEQLSSQLRLMLLPKDPNDDKDIMVEIRAGTGGDEASLFAGDLLRMYLKYADRMGWKT